MGHWEPFAETHFSALVWRDGRQKGQEEGERGSYRPDHPSGDPQEVLGRGEGPDCPGRLARRDEHRRPVPAGRDPVEPLLSYRQGRGTFGWSKDFLEAGKQRLVRDTERQAGSRQVNEMRAELEQLKQLASELSLKSRLLKKSLLGNEPPWDK